MKAILVLNYDANRNNITEVWSYANPNVAVTFENFEAAQEKGEALVKEPYNGVKSFKVMLVD